MSYEKTKWGRAIHYKSPITGRETTLYNIATVAEALGRTSQTVRKWEIGGIIPKTPFKSNKQRLYAEEHIDALIRCAEKVHLMQGSKGSRGRFSKYAFEEFQKVNELFFKEDIKDATEESKEDQ